MKIRLLLAKWLALRLMQLRFFPFHGPNWHADWPACEWLVWLDRAEREALNERGEELPARVAEFLRNAGIGEEFLHGLDRTVPRHPRARFAFLLNGAAIGLQRSAGHKVNQAKRVVSDQQAWLRAIYQVEDAEAGKTAGRLALAVMSIVLPELQLPKSLRLGARRLESLLGQYAEHFRNAKLPLETRYLMSAATAADIPVIRLDQPPFRTNRGRDRIRPGGALLLGQGVNGHVLDGMLCTRRGGKARHFMTDRMSIGRMLSSMGVPTPFDGNSPINGHNLLHAIRATERLGYPVAIKPVRKARGKGVTLGVRNVEQLMQAVQDAQALTREFTVERFIRGRSWHVLLSNGVLAGVLRKDLSAATKIKLAPSILETGREIARRFDLGVLALTVVTSDISQPLEQTGGAVVDVDVVPDLQRLLKPRSQLWGPVMTNYLRWLFPDQQSSRIPLVAVTGTNGKTTTSRMIDAIMRASGLRTHLSCSEGLYVDGKRVRTNQDKEHLRKMFHGILRSPETEAVVMEYYLSRLKTTGFAFDYCDIGVLTNVSGDHFQPGWETRGELAKIKGAVIRRAAKGAVLNADDGQTAELMEQVKADRVALTSVAHSARTLRGVHPNIRVTVTTEPVDGDEHIVVADGDARTVLMRTADIPATLSGAARFNVENALQAVAASRLMGIPDADIIRALVAFEASFENTPGRLNVHDNGQFRVIMDYAHNADGIKKLCQFTDQLDVSGRRILMFAVTGDRLPHEIESTVRAAIGHFDLYVCRNYPNTRGMERGDMPNRMRAILLEGGVPEDRVILCPDADAAIELTLRMANPGDLAVMTAGIYEMESLWARITAAQDGATSG